MNELESITARIDPPSVGEELSERATQRAILKSWFTAHPLTDIGPSDLIALVGPNYRSRIAELRIDEAMNIPNVPRWMEFGSGRRKRLSGGYRFLPFTPLGPSSECDRPTAEGLLFPLR